MTKPIRRALLSVYDKDGLVDLARALLDAGVELISSGGTARTLQDNGLTVTQVSDYTGHPEMLDGRVKTLHPRIHAGILAIRSNEGHMADLEKHDISSIDLVVVNLYPFERTAATEGMSVADIVEMIDIGGPTMVRSAAKNYRDVGVVVRPEDYGWIADEVRETGGLSDESRLRLSVSAFQHTSSYDTSVHSWLRRVTTRGEVRSEADALPERFEFGLVKSQSLRYGENPHQRAAFYRDPLAVEGTLAGARQLQGKELSFNNILDLDAALGLAVELPPGACVIVKHGNPCGVALASETASAFRRAMECDPVSAFGGIIAFNREVDGHAAEAIAETFFEAIIAPRFDPEACARLGKKKKLRLLEIGAIDAAARRGFDLRRVSGGVLLQDWDRIEEDVRRCEVVSARQPTDEEWRAMEFAWIVAKHVKSNAIVYANAERTVGVGAGQMSRVDSARFAILKAQSSLAGCVMASDAFFPFRDGIDVAAEAGITAVVQPGGSVRDEEVVQAANDHDMAMVVTGRRHFRH